jgi:hypothetical protein
MALYVALVALALVCDLVIWINCRRGRVCRPAGGLDEWREAV